MLYLAALLALPLARADWQFHSRPDLSPPRLNITHPASPHVAPGYLFLTPYAGFGPSHAGPAQDGPHIYTDAGELVWSGVGYFGGWAINFRPDRWDGRPVLRAFQGQLKEQGRMYGDFVVLNDQYETVRTVRPRGGRGRLPSAHEFLLLDGGNGTTALIETPIPRVRDLGAYGGKGAQQWIRSAGFQEIDLATGEVLFEWESLDHVDPKYSAVPLDIASHTPSSLSLLPNTGGPSRRAGVYNGEGYNTSDAWNYFHINSVDKDDRGDYLISGRCYSAIFKISGRTGRVLWQLGGAPAQGDKTPFPTYILPENERFAFQLDARFISRSSDGTRELISLHDNAAFNSPLLAIRNYSSARFIELDHTAASARTVRAFPAPGGLSGASQGNVQSLPNGNVFANWGQGGAVTEFSPEGEVLFHAFLDSAPEGRLVQSYRGFRFPWVGRPSEAPAIVALLRADEGDSATSETKGGGVDVDVYVSWNGDTETHRWVFYAVPVPTDERGRLSAKRVRVGEAKREGFETHLRVALPREHEVYAVAVDREGRELRQSERVRVEQRVAQVHRQRESEGEVGMAAQTRQGGGVAQERLWTDGARLVKWLFW